MNTKPTFCPVSIHFCPGWAAFETNFRDICLFPYEGSPRTSTGRVAISAGSRRTSACSRPTSTGHVGTSADSRPKSTGRAATSAGLHQNKHRSRRNQHWFRSDKHRSHRNQRWFATDWQRKMRCLAGSVHLFRFSPATASQFCWHGRCCKTYVRSSRQTVERQQSIGRIRESSIESNIADTAGFLSISRQQTGSLRKKHIHQPRPGHIPQPAGSTDSHQNPDG